MRYSLAPMVLAALANASTDSSHIHTECTLRSAKPSCTTGFVVTNTLTETVTTTLYGQSGSMNTTVVAAAATVPSCTAGFVVTNTLTETITTTLYGQSGSTNTTVVVATPSVVATSATVVAVSSAAANSTTVIAHSSVPILSTSSKVVVGTSVPTLGVSPIQRANGVGKLPALGFNSWSAYRGNINASIIEETAKKFIDLGLKDAGYEYVNMDDYWGDYSGRDSNGQLRADPSKFPDGIEGVVTKIHSLGLKAGIYSSASVATCGGYPASLNHEETDAATFASWGIDYLKYDNCQDPSKNPGVEVVDEYDFCTPQSDAEMFHGQPVVNGSCGITSRTAPPGYDWTLSNTYHRYAAMSKAIMAQEHEILFSLCDWGWADVRSWGGSLASSWRTSADIQDSWDTIMGTFNQGIFMSDSVDFWGHNDLDILQVGNGGLYPEECRTHFAMWAAMKAPLLIGTDLGSLSADRLAILKNQYLLAFSQDPVYGKPAVPFNWDWSWDRTNPTARYWSGQSNAGTLVLLFNPNDDVETMTAKWTDVPGLGGGSYETTDIWTGETTCVATGFTRSVIRHDTAGALVGKEC